MPVAASAVYLNWYRSKLPCKMVNSPTNPFVSGSATEESMAIKKNAASTGTARLMPPKAAMSRVWRRS